MKDTTELTEATQQAKKTTSRARGQTRAKTEQAIPASQEQEARPATRRRAPATHTATAARSSQENEPTAPAPRTSQERESATSSPPQSPPTHAPRTTAARGQHSTTASRNSGTATGAQHRPGQSSAHGNRNGNGQHGDQRASTSTATHTQRPGQHQHQHPAHGPASHPAGPQSSGQAGQRNSTHGTRGGSATAPARPTSGRPTPARRPSTAAHRAHDQRQATREKITGPVYIPPQIVVKDLAELLHTTPVEVIKLLIKHSVFASINQVVDYEKAAIVAQDLGFEPHANAPEQSQGGQGERRLSASEAMDLTRRDNNTVVIPPVVTIMGHVDHGKTSLLDVIRKTKVAAGEAGGITQHIGAYQVDINGKKITFLDTPGHEAFTAMRARGAQVAHIAIIVIAADDGVMPQTREAIDHARAAKMPIIIALNKIDKANANPERVKQQLAEMEILIEEYGGDTICVPVSARKGEGIDELLEYILLVAEVQEIRANPNRPASGVIIEAKLEKNSGPTATVLVQEGTLKMGDNFVVGPIAGKVRAMFNDRGKRIQKAPPSTPVSILGLPEVPQTGDRLEVTPDERTAKQRAQEEAERRRSESAAPGQVSLDTLYMQMQEGNIKELSIILKCDVQGSLEAIKNALSKLGEERLKVRLIHEGIGNITESDVNLASASKAIIIGFNVKADGAAQREAQKSGIDVRYYDVIYQLTDDIQSALTGLLEPTVREVIEGHAEVLQTFSTRKIVIAGCRVTDGRITRSSGIRVMRGGQKIHEGSIASLRRGKDDVREVLSGYECGIVIEDFNAFEIGDILEAFSHERVKPGA
ncbi:MAG: translation initiation factor IF-2 [Ktedonobacteraceae bacterium]|nr:translation initiation factor IF-2 [Ktedonobacteraceae bacterium]